jgi:hypothetical protein
MRSPPLPPRHLLLVAALLLPFGAGACNMLFGIVPGTEGSGGQGGQADTTVTSGAAGGTTGAAGNGGGGSITTSESGSAGGGAGGAAPALLDGCVLLLHMDENGWSGTDAVKDASGSANHGTVTGSAATTPDGKFAGAGVFDGNGWITVPDAPSLHPTTALTLAAWVYPTALPDPMDGFFPSPGIFSKRIAFDNEVSFTLFLWENNNAYVDIQGDRMHSNAVFVNDQWQHLAMVYDGNQGATERTRIYVDGALDSVHPSVAGLAVNTQNLQIGDLPGGGDRMIGRMDDLAIWTRALSDAEIKSIYEAGGPL